jgi:nicotinate-nucleotide adenylyltransferase
MSDAGHGSRPGAHHQRAGREASSWGPSIGLLGGAFDPPHHGHLAVAREALAQLTLRRLLVVVTAEAPHKSIDTPAETRLRLAEIAFAGEVHTEVSRVELDRAGPSYTLDTVRWAAEHHGETTFIVGADEFSDFLSWHDPAGVLDVARLAVATRPGFSRSRLDTVLRELDQTERVRFFPIPEIPTSSSEVRQRVKDGTPIDDLVPTEVALEIAALGLYGDATGAKAVPSDAMPPRCEGS